MPSDTDDRLTALARSGERTSRRVDELDGLLRRLAEAVSTLAQPGGGGAVAVRSWLEVEDPAIAAADLADLAGWVAAVYLRYPGSGLASCWLWHPAAVEELWVLRQAHADAFTGPAASWKAAADWHDRLRPGVVGRLRQALNDCELSLHEPGAARHRPAPKTPLALSTDSIAQYWTTDRTQPEPTNQQLDDAARHDRDEHTRT